jgi:hypothetical protein
MQTGWLAPNGDFYPCETFEHIAVAEELVDKLDIHIGLKYHADDILMESGWVKITRSLLGVKEQNIFWDKFLTEYQKKFLKPYFEENDELIGAIAIMRWEYENDK